MESTWPEFAEAADTDLRLGWLSSSVYCYLLYYAHLIIQLTDSIANPGQLSMQEFNDYANRYDLDATLVDAYRAVMSRTIHSGGHVHHVLPRMLGGSDEPSNLVRLTEADHAKAHALLLSMLVGTEHYNSASQATRLVNANISAVSKLAKPEPSLAKPKPKPSWHKSSYLTNDVSKDFELRLLSALKMANVINEADQVVRCHRKEDGRLFFQSQYDIFAKEFLSPLGVVAISTGHKRAAFSYVLDAMYYAVLSERKYIGKTHEAVQKVCSMSMAYVSDDWFYALVKRLSEGIGEPIAEEQAVARIGYYVKTGSIGNNLLKTEAGKLSASLVASAIKFACEETDATDIHDWLLVAE